MLTAHAPFDDPGDRKHKLLQNDKMRARSLKSRKISIEESAVDLFLKMTEIDPKKRYSIEQVKGHEWMNSEETASVEEVRDFY